MKSGEGIAAAIAIGGLLSGCLGSQTVCEQAEDVIFECTGDEVALGECTEDTAASARHIVDGGCDAIAAAAEGKADIFSALCIPALRLILPFCHSKAYQCDVDARDIDPAACNGSSALCDVAYDQASYATTHNAFSNAEEGFARPNQSKRLWTQLDDGVRGLMLDTHDTESPKLCHGDCAIGSKPLIDGLTEIKDFLDCNPREVVTIIIEPHLEQAAQLEAFENSGLAAYAFTHVQDEPWPTLGAMIESNRRLVVFTEQPDPVMPSWYHHFWDVAFDNDYSSQTSVLFNCNVVRGQPESASLFALNHFVTVAGGDELLSIRANSRTVLFDHINDCTDAFGRRPNFVSVDFYDIGDVLDVVYELNSLEE